MKKWMTVLCPLLCVALLTSCSVFKTDKSVMHLSNPNANETTKKVYAYICEMYENHIISGQQESTWVDGPDYEMQYLFDATGKLPAMRGLDFMDDDFDGVVYPNLFDSREMARTLNNNGEGAYEYTRRGKTLFSGMAAVEQGQFEFTFRMPLDINYSDEPGLLNLYALHASDGREAGGSFSRFLVGGTADDVAEGDTLGPDMLLYLNESGFRSGDRTNETPLFVAELEDEEGINTVGNGVGHDLTLVIDGSPALTYNLNDYYVPSLGDYTRGTVRFSIPELLPGRHTLTFRAWDLMNHSSRQSLEFEVVRGLRPGLLSVRCTQSPARESTTFVLEHNRPGSTLSVRLSAYDFSGREVWTHVEQGVSEGQEYYVEWDLCSNSGQRLSPGIYLYRASIASGGSRESTRAQKLLILAQ